MSVSHATGARGGIGVEERCARFKSELQSCWGYNQGVYNQPPPIVKAQRVPRFSEGRYQGDIKGVVEAVAVAWRP
jgi:hypothetical protein